MKIKKNTSGVYTASFRTASGKVRTVTTKCTNRQEAERVVKESGLADLEMAAKAGRLSHEAISKIVAGKKITVEKALDAYLEWMRAAGKAPTSIANTEHTCRAWIRYSKVGTEAPANI